MTGERAGKGQDSEAFYELRLYISGAESVPKKSLQDLRQLCETHLSGRYNIEVVDLEKQPERARQDRILTIPTLVKLSPPPLKRFFGDLGDQQKLLEGLGLVTKGEKNQT